MRRCGTIPGFIGVNNPGGENMASYIFDNAAEHEAALRFSVSKFPA